VPWYLPFLFCFNLYGVFVRFSTRGVQEHQTNLFEGSPCQKLLAKTVEGFFFPLPSFPFDFSFNAFLAVSLHEEPKNTTKMFSKTRHQTSKSPKKRYHGTYLAFFSFLKRPLKSLPHTACTMCHGTCPQGAAENKNGKTTHIAPARKKVHTYLLFVLLFVFSAFLETN
jgi:hypothetical protein